MSIFWPEVLGCPRYTGYSLTLGDNRRKTSPDAGPPRIRKQRSLSADLVSLQFDTDLNGRETFIEFYKITTFQGSLPFIMPDPSMDGRKATDETGAYILDEETGEPILIDRKWLCQFGEQAPVLTPNQIRWNIAFNIMVMP